jgi:hypothetical protein
MFSRRVFELLACGTAVLSTESVGIKAMFGDLVPIAESPQDATSMLERLIGDDEYHAALTGRARRLVLAEHTYRVRLAQIAATAGFDFAPTAGREIAALALVDESWELGAIEDALLAQSRAADEMLIGALAGTVPDRGLDRLAELFGEDRVRIVTQARDAAREARWRELATVAAAPWVAPLSAARPYGDHHLGDLETCTQFARADIIGAADPGALTHRYVEAVDPRAALATRAFVSHRGWTEDPALQRRWFEQGVRLYAGEHDSARADEVGIEPAAAPGAERATSRRLGRSRRG